MKDSFSPFQTGRDMNWRNDGFTLKEYLLLLENAYNNAYGLVDPETKHHPEDISLNLEVVNNVVAAALSNAWDKWNNK